MIEDGKDSKREMEGVKKMEMKREEGRKDDKNEKEERWN